MIGRYVVCAVIAACGLAVISADAVGAVSLRITPLEYRETLTKGQIKTGVVDIENPTGQTLQLTTSVQGFRQTDNQGSLEFYDDEQIKSGITTDLKDFELGPRERLRLVFKADPSKLPVGDVFAALFVATKPGQESKGVAQTLRLGTLLSLTNQTPGSREATIESLNMPFLQFGDRAITGTYTIRNTAKKGTASGFYPQVKLTVDPLYIERAARGSLIQAGIARQMPISIDTNRLGLYKVTVSYGTSQRDTWVFVATGGWRGALIGLIIAILALLIMIPLVRRRYYRRKKKSKPPQKTQSDL